jgi:signal transduction histidine kinase
MFSVKINHKESLLVFIFIIFFSSVFSQPKIDSLRIELNKRKGSDRIPILHSLALQFSVKKPDSAINYAKEAIFLSNLYKKEDSIGELYQILGKNYKEKIDFKSSLNYYTLALEIYKNQKNKEKKISELYNSMGIIYGKIYNYERAFYYFHLAVNNMLKNNDFDRLPPILNNIGLIYLHIKDYEKAKENFLRALYISKSNNNLASSVSSLFNLSALYDNLDNQKISLKYQFEALEICIKLKDTLKTAISKLNIGIFYNKLSEPNTAIKYLNEAQEIFEKSSDAYKYYQTYTLQNLGSAYLKLKENDKAYNYLKQAYDISVKIKDNGCIRNSFENFSKFYEKTGDYKTALEYYKKYKSINDSIFTKENSDKIAEMQVRYETEEKEKENEILRQKNTIQQLAIQKQIYLRNTFIAVSGIVILLIVLVLYRFYIKKKANKLLSEKNKMITEQKEKLELANATKDKFFTLLAHDLKTPFYVIMKYAHYLKLEIDKMSINERDAIINELNDYTEHIYGLLENLLTWSRSQRGMIHLKKEMLNVAEIVEDSAKTYSYEQQTKEIKLTIEIPENLLIYADKYTIKTVIGNIYNNAIKFTNIGGEIKINATKNVKNNVEILISDNGVGIDEDKIESLFTIGESYSTEGTMNEKGTGLGLIICKEFIDLNNGDIRVVSKKNEGSTFIIELPSKTEDEN